MIYIVLGTKAQLIKMAPVMRELKKTGIEYRFIHTGQHKGSMDEMYEDFDIRAPDQYLYKGDDITTVPQMLKWGGKILWKIVKNKKAFFKDKEKSIVLVHGDTFSTLLGSIMGRLSGVKVGHVESGLRSFNIFHPFPEELTRILVFRFTDVFFCPGKWAIENVRKYKGKKVNTELNTLYDTVQLSSEKNRIESEITGEYALVSLHRYENIFNRKRLKALVESLEKIAVKMKLIFILHPPTKQQLNKFGLFEKLSENEKIDLHDRLAHSEFLQILKRSAFAFTDGGSLQEECALLGIPCLLYRKATERQDGLGKNVVLSMYDEKVIEVFVDNYKEYKGDSPAPLTPPSKIIVESLGDYV